MRSGLRWRRDYQLCDAIEDRCEQVLRYLDLRRLERDVLRVPGDLCEFETRGVLDFGVARREPAFSALPGLLVGGNIADLPESELR